MRLWLIILFTSYCSICFGQDNSKKIMYGIGYGHIHDGWGDIPGQTFFVNALVPTKKPWLSVTPRIIGTLLEQKTNYSPYQILEKSNGVNAELDVNFHLRLWKLNIYPSIGPSIRYSDEQHVNTASIAYGKFGRVVEFDVNYEKSHTVHMGYTMGLNLDFDFFKNFIIGSRIAGMGYLNGTQYSYITITLKHKNLRIK